MSVGIVTRYNPDGTIHKQKRVTWDSLVQKTIKQYVQAYAEDGPKRLAKFRALMGKKEAERADRAIEREKRKERAFAESLKVGDTVGVKGWNVALGTVSRTGKGFVTVVVKGTKHRFVDGWCGSKRLIAVDKKEIEGLKRDEILHDLGFYAWVDGDSQTAPPEAFEQATLSQLQRIKKILAV